MDFAGIGAREGLLPLFTSALENGVTPAFLGVLVALVLDLLKSMQRKVKVAIFRS